MTRFRTHQSTTQKMSLDCTLSIWKVNSWLCHKLNCELCCLQLCCLSAFPALPFFLELGPDSQWIKLQNTLIPDPEVRAIISTDWKWLQIVLVMPSLSIGNRVMTQAVSRSPRKGHRFTPAESISCISIAEAVEEFFPETLLVLIYFLCVFFSALGQQTN